MGVANVAFPNDSGANVLASETNSYRLVDTRQGIGTNKRRLRAGESIRIPLFGAKYNAGFFLTVTAVDASQDGFLTIHKCGRYTSDIRPETSNLNFVRGQTVANFVTLSKPPLAELCLYSSAETDVIVDVGGYLDEFETGGGVQLSVPTRILDTRSNLQTPGTTSVKDVTSLQVGGQEGVLTPFRGLSGRVYRPTVLFNLTVTGSRSAGYVTVYSCDSLRQETSNINFSAGETIANQVIASPDESGKVCLFSSTPVQLIIDLNGSTRPFVSQYDGRLPSDWLTWNDSSFSRFRYGTPERAYDSRVSGFSKVNAGETIRVPVATNSAGAALNVTAVDPEAEGYLTLYACDQPLPSTSNLNYRRGANIANHAITQLSATGEVCIYSSAKTHILVDIDSLLI